MSLKERLQEEWKEALKAKDKFRATTISLVKAAVLLAEKSGSGNVDDEKIIEIISREVKQRRDAMLEFEKGNRQDLVDQNKGEIEILLSYLPQQLSKEEIFSIVQEAAVEVGANSMKDMKIVMAVVTPRTKGRCDGRLVNQIVKEILNK